MKFFFKSKTYGSSIIISLFILISCNNEKYRRPVENPLTIIKNFTTFWNYWNEYVKLGQDYISLKQNGNIISKDVFLKKLSTGSYLPLKLITKYESDCYKLYSIPNTTDPYIRTTIAAYGSRYYHYSKMEGKPLPIFHIKSLNNKVYTNKNCENKIVVINTWFIHCSACVAEMPALNKLVDSLRDKNKIIFLSLALDNKMNLKDFLQKTDFKYAVVPNMGSYIRNNLNLKLFPTHIIVNKKGEIENVTDDYKQMEYMLNKYINKCYSSNL